MYYCSAHKGGVVRAKLASCASAREWARPWPHAGTRLRHGRPALSTIVLVDPTRLKYLAVTVMTAASRVLEKSVHFLEHVSPGCCAGIASIVPVSWSV